MDKPADKLSLEWHRGLLFLNEGQFYAIAGKPVGNELRRRYDEIHKGIFLRPPYVIILDGEKAFSLQSLCVLCANTTTQVSASAEWFKDVAIYDSLFQQFKQLIVDNKAYLEFTLPPRPWKPFPAIERKGRTLVQRKQKKGS